jgi:hypothetical protein
MLNCRDIVLTVSTVPQHEKMCCRRWMQVQTFMEADQQCPTAELGISGKTISVLTKGSAVKPTCGCVYSTTSWIRLCITWTWISQSASTDLSSADTDWHLWMNPGASWKHLSRLYTHILLFIFNGHAMVHFAVLSPR